MIHLDRIAIRVRTRLALLLACVVASALFFPVPATATVTREAELIAANGKANARFGLSVSISGDTAVVGAPELDGATGAAYVFTRSDGTWTQRATLVAPIRVAGNKFGFKVAIAGDTIVVGEPKVDRRPPEPGAAHVFVGNGATWTRQATLVASDSKPRDGFGFDVAISGDTVVAGAPGIDRIIASVVPGSAHVFTRTDGVWSEQATLTASDGVANDQFGYSVGVSGDTAVVGAPNDAIGAAALQGSGHVFTRTGSTWTAQAKLVALDGAPGDVLGWSISVSDDTVVIGAIFDDIGLNPKQGSAYVFVRGGKSWEQQAKLTAPDGAAADLFGRAVAVEGDTVVVGAHFDEPDDKPANADEGSAYVFDRVADKWSEPTKLTDTDSGAFGVSVGVSDRRVIAGAGFTEVGNNTDQGAAYVFRLRPSPRAVTTDDRPDAKPSESAPGSVGPATPPRRRLPATR